METIIKKGYEKILELFYNEKSAKIHLRDISRKTKQNENSSYRFLNQLENLNVLKSEKDGNLKKYFINNNLIIFTIFTLFDNNKYNELPSGRKRAIRYFLEKLERQPIIVVLFGSTAKGNFTKKSDIDILIIGNNKIKTKNAEDYAESQTGIRINCFQIIYNDFLKELKLKEDNVIQSAINAGYPITNHIKYYLEVLG